MKKIVLYTVLVSVVLANVFSQANILTAADFFEKVSQNLGAIENYEADMSIQMDKNEDTMLARVSYKQPNLLRIDFSKPKTQAIVFNGNLLTIYLSQSNVILNQTVEATGASTQGMNLATPEGLSLMKRYYSISYLSGQEPVALDPDAVGTQEAEEMVVKLRLVRKNTTEGFRTIILSINPDTLLIRRVIAESVDSKTYTFDFKNYAINQNIPDMRFLFDMPSAGSTFNDFLFAEE